MNRRQLLGLAGATLARPALLRAAGMQMPQNSSTPGSPVQGAANVPMDETRYRSVRRPPRGASTRRIDREARNALEHRIHCQCGCGLDVYTCRTTDFSCAVSPAMHADAEALADGGYSADEILSAFSDTYGERALMAPPARGFNVVGWLMPFAIIGGGLILATTVLRRRVKHAPAVGVAPEARLPELSADDRARVDAAVRASDR